MFSTPAELTINEAEYDALLDEYEKAGEDVPGGLTSRSTRKALGSFRVSCREPSCGREVISVVVLGQVE